MTGSTVRERSGAEVVDAAPDGVAILDGDVFTSVNPAFAALFGFDRPDDLVGEPWLEQYHEDDRGRLDGEVLPAVREGDGWQGELRGIRRDGSSVTLELSAGAFQDGALIFVARDATDRHERDLERQFLRGVVDALDDVFYVMDEAGDIYMVNDRLLEVTGYTYDEAVGRAGHEYIPPEQHEFVPGLWKPIDTYDDQQVVLDILTKDGRRVPHEFHGVTVVDEGTGDTFRCGIARDVTERLEREGRLERQRDALRTLNRINELLLAIMRELIETPSRETVERTVCRRLADSDLYRFAWIGELAPDGTGVVPRVGVGPDGASLEELAEVGGGAGSRVAARAIETGEIELGSESPTRPSFETDAAGSVDGEHSAVAAIPLRHDDVVYGVLVVHAARMAAFNVLEQASFETLGETVGFVVNAIENRRLLFADAIVEIDLEIADRSLFYVEASASLDCTFELEGYVAAAPGRWLLYLGLEGVEPSTVADLAADEPNIEGVRLVDGDGARPVVEFSIVDGSLLGTLADIGATVRSGTVEDGVGQFTIEAPRNADVRSIVERVESAYQDTTLVARRERDRPVRGAERFSRTAVEDLTDRQRRVLEVAYRAGYFDWPRESTAEEVADAVGIAPATFHGHLRKGQRKLLVELFEER